MFLSITVMMLVINAAVEAYREPVSYMSNGPAFGTMSERYNQQPSYQQIIPRYGQNPIQPYVYQTHKMAKFSSLPSTTTTKLTRHDEILLMKLIKSWNLGGVINITEGVKQVFPDKIRYKIRFRKNNTSWCTLKMEMRLMPDGTQQMNDRYTKFNCVE